MGATVSTSRSVSTSGRGYRNKGHLAGLSTESPEKLGEHLAELRHQSIPGRLGRNAFNQINALIGLPWTRRLSRAALQVPKIRFWEEKYENLTNEEITSTSLKLKGRARGGESLLIILPEAFALFCLASRRVLGLRPFDVQLAAGVVIHEGACAEVATGEGKTLIAGLPTFLNGLTGKGVHVATVNDYLAKRDAEWLKPVYELLGLSVGVLQQQMQDLDRQRAYRSDVTYATASEFGFDFLRDRLKLAAAKSQETPFWGPWLKGGNQPAQDPRVQRDFNFVLVDEADNIFIDEARTPLIISGENRPATEEESVVYNWADDLAQKMKYEEQFNLDAKKQKLELTNAGRQLTRYSSPPTGPNSQAMDKLHEAIEQSLQAHYRFRKDQHYMIEKGKIVIIDEFTGRRMPDRNWREGLHQAVEAKERVSITFPTEHAAQITFQSYFKLYKKLSGMTGTARQNRIEIRRVYKIWVVCLPTNRPCIRTMLQDRVFPNEESKFDAIVDSVKVLHEIGRPILIGTRSVDRSESLSKKLSLAGIDHQVINAKQHEQEAQIVEHAGEKGRVTIATNMAGRGTDIKPEAVVLELGGLHVLGTERHEAARIDRQLVGRSGRQGDPGSAQFFVSLEDELLEGLGEARKERIGRMGAEAGRDTSSRWQGYASVFTKAQRNVEKRHFRNRLDLMAYEHHRLETLKDLGADPYVD